MFHIPNYSFADLLHIFFALRLNPEEIRTYEDLARSIDVSRRTVAGWFAGDYTPRTPEIILRLARALDLTQLQADLMLYAVDESWVRYGTPIDVLRTIELVRYHEHFVSHPVHNRDAPPSIAEIEQTWSVAFEDYFTSNYNRWGLGTKDDGTCAITRSLDTGSLVLTLNNRFHENTFMGGDSSCFAPKVYYATVQVRMVQGDTENDGFALIFEEISDNCHAVFRVRPQLRQASVVQTFEGSQRYTIYINRVSAPSIRTDGSNKLAILAIEDYHWFYINDVLVGQAAIPRLTRSRVDVGVIAGEKQTVVCYFQAFRVRVPRTADPHRAAAQGDGRSCE